MCQVAAATFQTYSQSMQGHSLTPLLAGEKDGSRSAPGVGYELHGTQAYFKDHFKILKMPIPMGTGRWELFNITNAPYKQNNLVLFEQDKLAELIAENKAYEEREGVIYTASPVIKKITSIANALLALGAMLFSVLTYILIRRRKVSTTILAAVQVVAVIGHSVLIFCRQHGSLSLWAYLL